MLHNLCQTYYILLVPVYQSPTGLADCCGVRTNASPSTRSPGRAERSYDIGEGGDGRHSN